MKKRDLATLALIGISAGLVVGGCNQKGKNNNHSNNNQSGMEQMSPDMKAFYSSLSPEAQKKFMELDAQHKMMAVEMANQTGVGENKCKGMGGCATANNTCAGENECKGQGGPPVKDPSQAVDVQHEHQMDQRQKMQNGMDE